MSWSKKINEFKKALWADFLPYSLEVISPCMSKNILRLINILFVGIQLLILLDQLVLYEMQMSHWMMLAHQSYEPVARQKKLMLPGSNSEEQ